MLGRSEDGARGSSPVGWRLRRWWPAGCEEGGRLLDEREIDGER